MGDLGALRELTLNRVRVMLREPEVLFWTFFFPILLAFGIGIAFSDSGSERTRVAVLAGPEGTPHLAALEANGTVEAVAMEEEEAAAALRRGDVVVVVEAREDGAALLRYDPTRPEARTARLLVEGILQEAAGGTRPLRIAELETTERGQRYIDWLIPGLIGFNLMGTGLWSVAFYTTQSRENQVLRRLVATPMRRSHFLISQILARFVFLVVEIPLIVLFAWLAFGVTVAGGVVSLTLAVALGAMCFTMMGLLAASRARTTEGVSGIINLIMMPMLVLSGVFFSVQRFPDAVRPLIAALPLTALNDLLRAIYNDGLGLGAGLPEIAVVSIWTVGSFLLALRLFRWQ